MSVLCKRCGYDAPESRTGSHLVATHNRIRALKARVKELEAGIWREQDEAIRQRDEAEAALAALSRQVLEDHRVGTAGYDEMMVMARAAGRESGVRPITGIREDGEVVASSAAKSAARPICFCYGNFHEDRAQYYLEEALWLHNRIREVQERGT